MPLTLGVTPCYARPTATAPGMEHAIARRREQALMAEAAENCRSIQ